MPGMIAHIDIHIDYDFPVVSHLIPNICSHINISISNTLGPNWHLYVFLFVVAEVMSDSVVDISNLNVVLERFISRKVEHQPLPVLFIANGIISLSCRFHCMHVSNAMSTYPFFLMEVIYWPSNSIRWNTSISNAVNIAFPYVCTQIGIRWQVNIPHQVLGTVWYMVRPAWRASFSFRLSRWYNYIWWMHDIGTCSSLLAVCERNQPVPDWFSLTKGQ